MGRISFFVRPDFCHSMVERRWRLRQLIKPFQEKTIQIYLINPAQLKVIHEGQVQYFSSEIKAREYLDALDK